MEFWSADWGNVSGISQKETSLYLSKLRRRYGPLSGEPFRQDDGERKYSYICWTKQWPKMVVEVEGWSVV